MTNFETHPKKLKEELLNSIHIGDTALPDFQRDFVWQPGQTHDLIVSLARSFPAGSLLRLESGAQMFQARAFAGAPPLNDHMPKYLMLDGQQRLTSLYQALYGKGEHRYFFSFRRMFAGQDLDSVFRVMRRAEAEKSFSTLEAQASYGLMPLEVIFGGDGFHSWLVDVQEVIEQLEAKGRQVGFASDKDTAKRVRAAYEQYVEPVEKYQFPVVTLAGDTSLEAVCTIFETLNNTGVKLSVFDLLSARFYAAGTSLRQLWQDALDTSALLKTFDIDPYYILQSICLQEKQTNSKSDVLALTPEVVVKHWDDAIWGMDEALKMLHEECGVLKPELLSYNTILVPMAAAFAARRTLTGADRGAFRTKIQRWYWCSVFSQTYESGPNTQAVNDLREIATWLEGGELPKSVSGFNFDPERLLETTTRQRAVYRGLLCLILRNRPMDFHSTKPLTPGLMAEGGVDDHHIFPAAYLRKTIPTLKATEIDAIVNRTLIDRETNQRISANAPSVYLLKIATAWDDAGMLDKVLASHVLPIGTSSSLRNDDFDSFRHERAEKLYDMIVRATC